MLVLLLETSGITRNPTSHTKSKGWSHRHITRWWHGNAFHVTHRNVWQDLTDAAFRRRVFCQIYVLHRYGSNQRSLQWRHNGHDSVSNHQPHDWLLNRLFRCRSKKTSKLRVTGLCEENSPGTAEFLAQMASNAEIVSIWWRHHDWQFEFFKCIGRITLNNQFPHL